MDIRLSYEKFVLTDELILFQMVNDVDLQRRKNDKELLFSW